MSPEFIFFPESQPLVIPDSLRPALKESLLLGKNIHRFTGDDLPPQVVKDNVHDHTLRLHQLATTLPFPHQIISEIKTTVLIHDIPEIICLIQHDRNRDLTAPEKAKDPILAQQIATEETRVAFEIFTDQEMTLYEQFENASKFVSGQELTITQVGIFSKILDSLDANITLHHQLSHWAQSDACNLSLLRPGQSLTYCFRQYLDLTSRLHSSNSQIEQSDLDLLLNLLEQQIFYIRQYWQHVPTSNIPLEIRPFI